MGSSPLTWGKPRIQSTISFDIRIIPTHAGRTEDTVGRLVTARAHPRSRGENEAGDEKGSTFDGSSPLTRGKPPPRSRSRDPVGLIPAHAGSTSWMQGSRPTCGAHPHSRGENHSFREGNTRTQGSSPLTRGKLGPVLQEGLLERLIPAHAGKTGPTCLESWLPKAHPRSRGENMCNSVRLLCH